MKKKKEFNEKLMKDDRLVRKEVIPDWDQYYGQVAIAVAQRSNCLKGKIKVGAIIVKSNRVVATGYNGVPSGCVDCLDFGCDYCKRAKNAKSEMEEASFEATQCICLHAEQNAIVMAAKLGISVDGGRLYSTREPCFVCFKLLKQAGISEIYYSHEWAKNQKMDESAKNAYALIRASFNDRVKQLEDLNSHILLSDVHEKRGSIQVEPKLISFIRTEKAA